MSIVFKQTNFEGPLDLLLQLIEDEELDITTISLGEVTDQYLNHVKELSRENLPEISDYLVIAARLVLIKSRALLPTEVDEEAEPDDLAAQLLEYRAYKKLAAELGEGIQAQPRSFGKAPAAAPELSELMTDGVSLERLHQAFHKALDRLPETPLPEETLDERITIEDCINQIKTTVKPGPVAFSSLFAKLKTRLQMIVTFLAILELIKQSFVVVGLQQRQLTVEAR